MVMSGKGVKRGTSPAVAMESVAARWAEILGVKLER
jgi:predicted nucleic acid-binding Zn ribbon protein